MFKALSFTALSSFVIASVASAVTITSVGVSGYVAPGYVVTADSVDGVVTTNRHRIDTTSVINFGSPPASDSFMVKWRLLDPADTEVATGSTVLGINVSGVKTVSGTLTLSSNLAVGTLYRVKLILNQNGTDVLNLTEAVGHTFIHLPGTAEATTALNTVGVINSVSLTRSWLLQTDATRQSIPVSVGYTMYRYDHWTSAASALLENVGVTFTAVIKRTSDGAVMPSTTSNATANVLMYEFSAGSPKTPDFWTPAAQILQVTPTSILPPDNYSVEVTMTHIDTPPATIITGNTSASASSQLLHFNGTVKFGATAINTTATSFSLAPAVYGGAPADILGSVAYRSIAISAGTLNGSSGAVTYTGTFNVRLTALGDAVVLSGSTIATGSAGADDINGVEYTRGAVTLNSTGAHANIAARLPTGVGWTASRDVPVLDSTVDYGTQDLTQSLDPAASTISISPAAGSFFICEETKPVYVEATLFQWETTTGSFKIGGAATAHSIVNPLLTALAGYVYTDPAVAVKRSNHFLYNSVTVATNTEFKKGTSGGGEMSTELTLSPGDMVTHFPYDANVKWDAATSFVKIANDLIDTTSSALNTTTYPLNVAVNYYQHCQEVIEGSCGGSPLTGTTTISASAGGFAMTGDGGLFLPGSVSSGGLLKWGYSSTSATFAHELTTGFTTGNFLMAGTFLRGDKNPTTDEDGAAVLLLSGFSPSNLANAERPMTTPYLAGTADYPGVNFRSLTGGPYSAQSRISGTVVGPYSLTGRSKYYARLSGVTGIHESPTGPGGLLISGYNFTMSTFGFSFLSNDMEDSRTAGSLALPAPTNFTLAFDEVGISCLGVLEELELSTATSATDAKEFDAWNALFTARSASFEPSDPCNVNSPIYLELGFSTHASHFDANTFVGSLGILNTGHFARPADSVPVPSRLTLPGALTLTGTTGETYQFFPNQGAYLNDAPTGDGDQFWSLFGTLDVPFFDDMKVHLQVHCGSLTPGFADPEIVSEVQIQGGWPSNGWLEGGQEPYDAVTFDTANKGYTGTLAAYRDSATEAHQPRAQKKWLGVVNFDYPLLWSNSAFNFTGMSAITSDLLVINTEHQLKYLDANNAEITFGVQYDGMPQINTANMLFNALDEVTGVKEAIKDAVGDTVFSALENGVDDFNAMLSDQMEDLIGQAVKDLTVPVLQAFLNEVRIRTNNGTLAANLNTMLDTYFRNPSSTLVTELDKLGNSISTGTSVVSQIDDRLARIQVTISAIIDRVQFDPNDPTSALTENVDGLLRDVDIGGGEFEKRVFMTVAQSLINLLQAAVNSSEVQAELSRVLADLNPTLESVKSALTQVNEIITQLRTQLSTTTNFAAELQAQVTAASAQIQAVSTLVANHAEELIAAMTLEDQTQIDALIAEWQQSLSQEITDAIMGSQFVADIQESIKERIYDLQGAFNSAVDTAFAAVNDLIRQALSPVLAELDNTINGALGSVNAYVGAGSLVGYARINADSLDEARIDGSFELKVPDEMTLKAYLQIKELDSDGPAGCSTGTGDNITEVTIGALDIPLGWVGVSGDGLHADLGVKFALNSTTAEPTGLGGSFELTQGEISFETFKITDLGASVMFGLTENYLAAQTSMEFGEYAMSGGVFFGRACDRAPLEMIDPRVSSVLTMSSFTGVYCYGEATFPIYGTGTCFFNISGKAGAGVFYFEEGPTYGGRLTMGIYGEALCAVEVGGEVSLVGLKSGSTYAFAGSGRIYGRAGPCPICVEADFRPSFNYTDANGWKVNF